MGGVKSFFRAGGGIDPVGAGVRNYVAPHLNPNAPTGDSALTLQNVGDPGGLFHSQWPVQTFDPNAPGSIFANRQPAGPAPNLPPPGTATNGLAGGAMNGGIDWAPIIAKALRKS